MDFHQPEGSSRVQVTAEVGEEKESKTFEGDLLVAADGSMSQVRAKFRPQDKPRYRYWRPQGRKEPNIKLN